MLYAIVGVLALLLDQITKYLTVANVALNTYDGPSILGLIGITYIRNYGAAFGLLENKRWILFVLLVIFLAAMAFLFFKGFIRTPFSRLTGALLTAGALGNGIDRLIYGYVVDMVEVLPGKARLPIFNLADCLITICGVLFCVSLILSLLRKDEDFEDEYEEQRTRRPRRADPFSEPEEGAHDPFASGRVPRKRRVEPEARATMEDLVPVRRQRSVQPVGEEAPVRRQRPVQPVGEETPVRRQRPVQPVGEEAPVRRQRPVQPTGEEAPVRRQRPVQPTGEEAPVRRQRPVQPTGEEAPVRRQRPVQPTGEEAPVRRQRPVQPTGEEAPVRRQRPVQPAGEEAPVRRQRPAAPAQQPVKKPAPAPKAPAADDFDLDAIMAEFK